MFSLTEGKINQPPVTSHQNPVTTSNSLTNHTHLSQL